MVPVKKCLVRKCPGQEMSSQEMSGQKLENREKGVEKCRSRNVGSRIVHESRNFAIEKKLGKNPPKNRSIMNRWRCVLFTFLRALNEKS